MKDKTFGIVALMFLVILIIGNKAIIKSSDNVLLKDSVFVLNNKVDSLRSAYFKLEFYTIDIENICDKYKSSRDAKYRYHLENKTINPL